MMIIRNVKDLKMNEQLAKVETNIYEDKNIGIIFVLNYGFVLFNSQNDVWDEVFVIKTITKPMDYTEDTTDKKILNNKAEFIQIIHDILNKIYSDANIKEYEKKHPEYIFMELFDKLNSGDVELIDSTYKYYDEIDDAFLRLDVEQMKNFAKSTSFRLRALFSPQTPKNQAASQSLDEKLKKYNMH